jgi:hypothetical protein
VCYKERRFERFRSDSGLATFITLPTITYNKVLNVDFLKVLCKEDISTLRESLLFLRSLEGLVDTLYFFIFLKLKGWNGKEIIREMIAIVELTPRLYHLLPPKEVYHSLLWKEYERCSNSLALIVISSAGVVSI